VQHAWTDRLIGAGISNNTFYGCGAESTQSDIFVAACGPTYDVTTGLPTKNGNPIKVGQPFAQGRIVGNRFIQVDEPHHGVELYGFAGLDVSGNTITTSTSVTTASQRQHHSQRSNDDDCGDLCGSFDGFDISHDSGARVFGWAVDAKLSKPNVSSFVSFQVDGVEVLSDFLADSLRPDLVGKVSKEPQHGFDTHLPAAVAIKLLKGNHTLAVFARRQDGSKVQLNKKLYCVNEARRSCAFPADCSCGAAPPSRMLISNSVQCSFAGNLCDGKPCSAPTPAGGCVEGV
jgi:hypothetical protein